MNIYNSSKSNIITNNAKTAKNIITRAIGLLFKKSLSEDEALILKPSCSIHTFFMKFPIDVLFIDRKNKVIALYENVPKNRILPIHWNSMYVVELNAGQISAKNIEKGDVMSLS